MDFLKASELLKDNKVGVLPTDTIYGLVGSALSKGVVEKIYKLRKRSFDKPMIILISSLDDLKLFDVQLDHSSRNVLQKVWPNKVSVILPCPYPKFEYLHRGKNTLAFRMPNDKQLLGLLAKTGPLVAPSANFEGERPAESILEAKGYFGDLVDFYLDKGLLKSEPSTLIDITSGEIKILRQGAFAVKNP